MDHSHAACLWLQTGVLLHLIMNKAVKYFNNLQSTGATKMIEIFEYF